MAPSSRPWIVSPHGPLEKLEPNLWTVHGMMGNGVVDRRMNIVRRANGSLWFFHAVPLAEPELDEVLAWGKPEALILGHGDHGLDATPFARKLGVKIYGPRAHEAALRQKHELAGTLEALPEDPHVRFLEMRGTKKGDAAGLVTSGDRVSVMFSDCYQDHTHTKGVARLFGFRGGPKVVPLFRFLFTKDAKALRAHLEELAATPGLARILPTHGPMRTEDPAGTLRAVAARL